MNAPACLGCIAVVRRWRGLTPRLVCSRYHRPAIARCIDYRGKDSQAQAAFATDKAVTP